MVSKLQNLENYLNARVIGQEDALARVSRAIEVRSVTSTIEVRGPRVRSCSWAAEASAKRRQQKRSRSISLVIAV
jgi:hypothetical protein